MKILDWMQGKFNGKQATEKSYPISPTNQKLQEHRNEEFSDWPNGCLLAIGTFGNNDDLKKQVNPETTTRNFQGSTSSSSQLDQLQEHLTPEEVKKIRNELNLLLLHNKQERSDPTIEFVNCSSRLEMKDNAFAYEDDDYDGSTNGKDEEDGRDDILQRSGSVVFSREKDVCLETTQNVISRGRTLSFLLKKMFVCSSGFAAPTPTIRDPVPKSIMEKILRAMLNKKIYPQSYSRSTLSRKKSLEKRHKTIQSEDEDEIDEKAIDGSKWVNTDSEYIVLEI